MATAKKTPAKKATKPAAKAKVATPAKKATKDVLVSQRTVATAKADQKFTMPLEVKDWIERAQSIMNHQKGQIERLKKENTELKAYQKWAQHRILRSDYE